MIVTVKSSDQPREYFPGQVYREGTLSNFFLIISKTECVDLGSNTHAYIRGPLPLSAIPLDDKMKRGVKFPDEVKETKFNKHADALKRLRMVTTPEIELTDKDDYFQYI